MYSKRTVLAAVALMLAVAAGAQSRSSTTSGNSNSTSRSSGITQTKPSRSSGTSSSSAAVSSPSSTPSSETKTVSRGNSSAQPSQPGGDKPQGGAQQSPQSGGSGVQPSQPGASQVQQSSGTGRVNNTPVNNGKYKNTPQPVSERVGAAKQKHDDAHMDYKSTKKQVKVDPRQYPTYGHQDKPGNIGPGRPPVPPRPSYTSAQRYARTGASSIVVTTDFRSIQEAMEYVERLLIERYYVAGAYVSASRIDTEMTLIPTGYNTTAMFAMHFRFSRSCRGAVKVTVTAQWRESAQATRLFGLVFQPDDRYATYYAWNVLEDIAGCLPHKGIVYRR